MGGSLPTAPHRRCEPRSFHRGRKTFSPSKPRGHKTHATSCARLQPRWSSSCGWKPLRLLLLYAGPRPLAGSAVCLSLALLALRFAAGGDFTLTADGLHPRDVTPHAANLLETLRLPHVELELQLEE